MYAPIIPVIPLHRCALLRRGGFPRCRSCPARPDRSRRQFPVQPLFDSTVIFCQFHGLSDEAGTAAVFRQKPPLGQFPQHLLHFIEHSCQQLGTADVNVRTGFFQRSDRVPQFLRHGNAGVPDVDADADNGMFQLAGFQTDTALGENAAAFLSVQIEIVHPLDLHLRAV